MMLAEQRHLRVTLDDYEPYIGERTIERIKRKARRFRGRRVMNVSSTYYGGGVAAMLSPLTLLINDVGIRTGWWIIQGSPDFFAVTKAMHNGLQGAPIELTDQQKDIYEQVDLENAVRNDLRDDFVIVHDPQPLPQIEFQRRTVPWIWRCHIDLTKPDPGLWSYLRRFIDQYHAAIVSIPEYSHDAVPPLFVHMPAIAPFTLTNRELADGDIAAILAEYPMIPLDLPLVVQVSRFDVWKDPQGVIDAFRIARKKVDCTLVLLGSAASDDPEGDTVYRSLLDQREERIIILNVEDSLLVNALQRKAAVVLQKSTREGFGLTVAEAMWKGAAVIGGNVGGIRYQIENGVNGFLVSSVQEAADRIVQVLAEPGLREKLGQAGRETVRRKFLMSRALEQHLDLFESFEISVRVRPSRVPHMALSGKA
jgi:trehalose synthase